MEKSSYEIGIESDKKEKELQEAIQLTSKLEQEILLLQRQIIELSGKKKDLEYSKSKASQNQRVIASELRILKSQFFAARNEGR